MFRTLFPAIAIATFFYLMPSYFVMAIDNSATPSTDVTLAQLENRFFEHQYTSDTDIDRVNRLEQFIFGCTESGSVKDRLQHIVSTIPDQTPEKINNSADLPANSSQGEQTLADSDQDANAKDTNKDQQANAISSDDGSDYSSYPRVTSLEQELLGHTYTADVLPNRLGRLEIKAFGTPSTSTDLGQRVDNLDDYAQRNDIYGERKIANNTNSNLAIAPMRSNTNSSYAGANQPQLNQGESYSSQQSAYTSKTGSFLGSIEERVAMMEAQEFNHTYPEKPLDKRLRKLEKKILPNQDDSQLGLFERTGKLWIALHPTDKSKVDAYISSNQQATPSVTSQNNDLNNYSSSNAGTTNNATQPHHGWLHKLASTIGSTATGLASSSYSGYPNYSSGSNGYPYPGSFYVPANNYGSPNSSFIGGSFGPGAGPGGLPVGFW